MLEGVAADPHHCRVFILIVENRAINNQQPHHKVRGRLFRFLRDYQLQHWVLQEYQTHCQQANTFAYFHCLEKIIEVLRVETVLFDVFEIESAQVDFNIIKRLVNRWPSAGGGQR